MDRITAAFLAEYTREYDLNSLDESKQFEHFSAHLTVGRLLNDGHDAEDVVVGGGGDTGIDAIAVIVNGSLVNEVEEIDELIERNGYLDVSFVFVQAERSSNFETAKIGQFGFGVQDFFREEPTLVRGDGIDAKTRVMTHIYSKSSLCHRAACTT